MTPVRQRRVEARHRRPASHLAAFLFLAAAPVHAVEYTIHTFAGSGIRGHRDGPAAEAEFDSVGRLALADDGAMYVSDAGNGVRVIRDGFVETVPLPTNVVRASAVALHAGALYAVVNLAERTTVDVLRPSVLRYELSSGRITDLLAGRLCSPLRDGQLFCRYFPNSLAFQGNDLLIGTFLGGQVYSLSPDGTEFLFAGRGEISFGRLLNEGGAPQGARIPIVGSVDVDRKGNVVLSDGETCRVREVDTKGIIRTVAGGGGTMEDLGPRTCGYGGDGGLATEALLDRGTFVAVHPEGGYVVGHTLHIRRVQNGRIETIAGLGESSRCYMPDGGCCAGDGGPALEAELFRPGLGEVDDDGVIYFAETDGCPRVRILRPKR